MGVMRQLFGPSKNEMWQQLSQEIEAQFIDGGFWRGSKVEARVGEWTITLDTYVVSTGKTSTTYTRMRAPYVNKDGFRFTIYRRGLFSDLGLLFGGQDILVGDPLFDEAFIIKGTDEQTVRRLFENAQIRTFIASQPRIHLTVKDSEGWFGPSFPPDVDELSFHVIGVIKDVERLKVLFELFAEALQQLCLIGSAYENDPQVQL